MICQSSLRPARSAGVLASLLLSVVAIHFPEALAQPYPAQPIKLVSPWPPGGSNDTFSRLIANRIGPALGQTVVVDNRPGATGTLGVGQVAGDVPVVVETPLGRIGMSICYDFIFPDFIRRLVELGADIVINSTNWISDGFQRDQWGWTGSAVDSLARTRALENGVWLAMANCIGPEAGFDSLGYSCVVAPSGKVLASAGVLAGSWGRCGRRAIALPRGETKCPPPGAEGQGGCPGRHRPH